MNTSALQAIRIRWYGALLPIRNYLALQDKSSIVQITESVK